MMTLWCRTVIQQDAHAAKRLRKRYGMDLTDGLKARLFDAIEHGRAAGGRHPHACMLPQTPPRERWLVSTGGRVFHLVIAPPCIVTFLPLETNTP